MISDPSFVTAARAEAECRIEDLIEQMQRLIADGGRLRLSLRLDVEACHRALAMLGAVTANADDARTLFLEGVCGGGVDEDAFVEDDTDAAQFAVWSSWLQDVVTSETAEELQALLSRLPELWGSPGGCEPTGPSAWERLANDEAAT